MQKLWSREHNEKIIRILMGLHPDRQEDVLRGLINDFEGVLGGDTSMGSFNELAHTPRKYRINPVSPTEFLMSPKYLGLEKEVYPRVGEEFAKINSGDYVEIVLTGAIGTAKTTLALWTTAYQVYLLACLRNPQQTFGIERSSEILFVFQSLNATLAKQLNYDRFRSLIQSSPFFTDYFPFNMKINTECLFPNRIIVRPVSGQESAAIGQNVFGGLMDEVNFMEVTEKSQKTDGGGEYNQAIALYNSLSFRRKSRFMKKGKLPGVFCLVSSARYPGQFTDLKKEEAKTDKTIYIYDKRPWDVLPEDKFTDEWFDVFIGDLGRKPRVLEADDPIDREKEKDLIIPITVDYRGDFDRDILKALRDVAGVSTMAIHPFIMNQNAVAKAFGTVESILTKDTADFDTVTLGILRNKFSNPQEPRWVHIDLSITGDATGVSCGYVNEFKKIQASEDTVEILPNIVFDFMLRVTPPKNEEIKYHKIRNLLYLLRDTMGLNIKWISCDSFQSTDMMQLLRRRGFTTGMVSMDKLPQDPYAFLKTAFYQFRVDCPEHRIVKRELFSLEIDTTKKGKIDHPPNGSKDVADSMAGVIYGLTMRRETWSRHGISPFDIPDSVTSVLVSEDKMREGEDTTLNE